MQITIKINTTELLQDLRTKSQAEVESIEDAQKRYAVQAGTDKDEELTRDLQRADALLRTIISKFLSPDENIDLEGRNEYGIPAAYSYILSLSDRRADGKTFSITDMIHSYLVDMTLCEFYSTVMAPELAKERAAAAQADAEAITRLLYIKKAPL